MARICRTLQTAQAATAVGGEVVEVVDIVAPRATRTSKDRMGIKVSRGKVAISRGRHNSSPSHHLQLKRRTGPNNPRPC